MKLRNLLFVLVFLTNYSFSYDALRVRDPQNPWLTYATGTIEEAIISIKPKGIYMEYGVYLTFSARGNGFSNSDTLEVEFDFDLPENAIVHDYWLWVDSLIIRAEILDQSMVSQPYEYFVNRGSVLYKLGQFTYGLRIFPMAGDEERKVKITYLCPTQWNSTNVISSLPINLLRASYNPLFKCRILTWLNPDWQNPKIIADWLDPKIVEFPEIEFTSKSDSVLGEYMEATIFSDAIRNNLDFSLSTPLKNGLYVSKFEDGGEGIYQMAFLPSVALDISTPIKVAFLVDNTPLESRYKKEDVINLLRFQMHNNLTGKDSFNIIFSGINIQRLSENWIPADSATIENIFQEINLDQVANYSNLPSLLTDGIDFIKNKGNNGCIMLISNSDKEGDYKIANDLIDGLMGLMNPPIPIHVVDYQDCCQAFYDFGGVQYWGNDYFYLNITRLTAANYFALLYHEPPLSGMMFLAIQTLSGPISSFDLHTKLQNGFCYDTKSFSIFPPLWYYTPPDLDSVYLNNPIFQVGKFSGTLPFTIEASGVYNSTPFSQTFTLSDEEVFASDSLNDEIWAGSYIRYLERQPKTKDIIDEIVTYSINERVLSVYSAFLCLEPSRGGKVCYDCSDESELPDDVEDSLEVQNNFLLLSAYPNPFNSQVNLNVKLPGSFNPENLSFRIYDILGQVVKTFEPDLAAGQKEYRFMWDGTNDEGYTISSGIYFFIVTTPEKNYSVKLLLMK